MPGAKGRGEGGEEDGEVTGPDQAKPLSYGKEGGFCFEGGGDNLAMAAFAEVRLGVRNN